jgi:hypothetical protein
MARFGVRSWKLSNVGQSLNGWPNMYYLELLRASEGASSRWSRLHLKSLAPTNPHWARVVGYGPFSLCVIHKEGLWLSIVVINRLMMCNINRFIFQYPSCFNSCHVNNYRLGYLFRALKQIMLKLRTYKLLWSSYFELSNFFIDVNI